MSTRKFIIRFLVILGLMGGGIFLAFMARRVLLGLGVGAAGLVAVIALCVRFSGVTRE